MCRRNIRESLTARIFLLTLLLLLGAGGLTFGLIAWATPITYVSVVGDRLQVQVSELTDRLALTKLADAGPILDVFVRESGAAVSLASPDGESVDTGSLYVSVTTAVQESDSVSTYTYGADGGPAQRERAGHYVTTALSDALIAEVTFADRAETYQLLVVPPMRLANQAVEALNRAAPCLALALLAFSLLCAVGYSRYLARPIVRISSIAGRMAELDFQWKCGETRRDEIGALGRSLDEMAERLSAALAELEEANAALRGDMERHIMGDGILSSILSYTSGACDARMSGAMIPVMSNSGSGNQGISATLPVVVYAEKSGAPEEKKIRALILSNLTVIYIKQSLGRLSALCGCVVAATGSSCGITYLMGGDYGQVAAAVKNMIANLTGMICDGAKPSCSMKLTSGVSTAVISAMMAMDGHCVTPVEGIIEEDVDKCIRNLTAIGRDGMNETDRVVLGIMTHKC